ncbi:olfactory receptor 1-like [Spea bombifrons]|uniref:olfactory receptor 1-like n=1 Tax=Spea bombifrons TaxID=233779 RepID=UPI0023490241|nr:olfactory receptor 1-like [Spea bombifrons]
MDNQTIIEGFKMFAFSNNTERKPLLFILFFFLYIPGIIGNVVIIIVVIVDAHLHTPMYFFLCNLSTIDIFYTTVIFPKLMGILLTGNNLIPYMQCIAQMYFFVFTAGTEVTLLSCMAYDRYIAICNPLHYHFIMNNKHVLLLMFIIWTIGLGNASIFTGFVSKLSFCRSNSIQHFYCDTKALAKICPEITFHIIIYVDCMVFGLCTFLLSLTSYIKIINNILHIKSKASRRKVFSTCTSHLIVLLLFYVTSICTYMMPTSGKSDKLDQVFSAMYTAVTPMLNPLIYSLRNKDVKCALRRIVMRMNSRHVSQR